MSRQKKSILKIMLAMLVLSSALSGNAYAIDAPSLTLEPVATGLNSPVGITHAGDGSGRLFITLQNGVIVIHDGTGVLPVPFLDIQGIVSCCGERGLLSAAFHPDFANNGFFFVNYTNNGGDTVVARYSVSGDPNVADAGSAQIIFTLGQPFSNHNGGQIQFGPDGYLYIGTGDGGSANDPGNRAQDPQNLLGKMLRIDIDGALPYSIPADNPFVGDATTLDEIWALGLRNPWRFSFDRLNGDLYVGDVGQNQIEEVSRQPAGTGGLNYGWRLMEGNNCFNPTTGCNDGTLTLPILQYTHSLGCSITGGYRYRGTAHPSLSGLLLFGDYCSGTIWAGVEQAGNWTRIQLASSGLSISAFGEDESGELYVADIGFGGNGGVYRIRTAPLCEIAMTKAVYVNGETATASTLRLANPGSVAVAAELKIWIGRPNSASTPVANFGSNGSFVTPPGLNLNLGPVAVLPITQSVTRGSYEFSCRMLNPTTGALLSESRGFFQVQ